MADVVIREGFLCPICMNDLGTVAQLQSHFEQAHDKEDKDVINQLKGLFDKAVKSFIKSDKDEPRPEESLSLESSPETSYKKPYEVNTAVYLAEGQELGAVRSLTSPYKKIRSDRIDHYVIETNRLIIRLDKLISPGAPDEPSKRKAYEKSIVPWQSDEEVRECKACHRSFNITRRRHHCRLCGSIMCNRCSHFMSYDFAKKMTNPAFQFEGEGFHRSSSSSSLNSLLSPEGEVHIRTCENCRSLLERRDKQVSDRQTQTLLVQLYSLMQEKLRETENLLPHFLAMSTSLNDGETKYSLEDAQQLRNKLMKLYEIIDSISKDILKLGNESNEPPGPKQTQLQRMIRAKATTYLQEHLMGLQSLPSQEELHKIQDERKRRVQKRIDDEKKAAAKRAEHLPPESKVTSLPSTSGTATRTERTPDSGWTPFDLSARQSRQVDEGVDPLVLQMDNLREYIRQAKKADKWEEVATLEDNLRELKREYLRQSQHSQTRPQSLTPAQNRVEQNQKGPNTKGQMSDLSERNKFNINSPVTQGVTSPDVENDPTNPFSSQYNEQRIRQK